MLYRRDEGPVSKSATLEDILVHSVFVLSEANRLDGNLPRC